MSDTILTNVHNKFLTILKENNAPVTVFLVCGVRLQGIITHFDEDSLLLKRDGHIQLVFKHSISTVMPVDPIGFDDEGDAKPNT